MDLNNEKKPIVIDKSTDLVREQAINLDYSPAFPRMRSSVSDDDYSMFIHSRFPRNTRCKHKRIYYG